MPPPTGGQLQAVRIMVIEAAHDGMVVVCQFGMIVKYDGSAVALRARMVLDVVVEAILALQDTYDET